MPSCFSRVALTSSVIVAFSSFLAFPLCAAKEEVGTIRRSARPKAQLAYAKHLPYLFHTCDFTPFSQKFQSQSFMSQRKKSGAKTFTRETEATQAGYKSVISQKPVCSEALTKVVSSKLTPHVKSAEQGRKWQTGRD